MYMSEPVSKSDDTIALSRRNSTRLWRYGHRAFMPLRRIEVNRDQKDIAVVGGAFRIEKNMIIIRR